MSTDSTDDPWYDALGSGPVPAPPRSAPAGTADRPAPPPSSGPFQATAPSPGPAVPAPSGPAVREDGRQSRPVHEPEAREVGTSVPDAHAAVYLTVQRSPAFQQVRGRYRRFVLPASAAFLAWYLAYVVTATAAPGLMARPVAGELNVAMAAGLGQFATTFVLTWAYARHARLRRDRLALELRWEAQDMARAGAVGAGGTAGTAGTAGSNGAAGSVSSAGTAGAAAGREDVR